MGKTTMTNYDDVLDEQSLQLLGDAPAAVETEQIQMQNLRDRVMHRVDDHIASKTRSLFTVRNHDGDWIEIEPKIKKKVLFTNPETGTESYLLRLESNAEAPAHFHQHDEHCLVLEGDLSFGDIHLQSGDYHFAPAGSEHAPVSTSAGALLYIQTGESAAL